MNKFNLSFLAQYFNHILGEDLFDIKAHYNNYVRDDKVKGTLQGTIYPVYVKNVNAFSSAIQFTFEVPCDNELKVQTYMERIENLCGESTFILDATYIEVIDGEEVEQGDKYKCLSQIQMERPMSAPSESNGTLMLIVQLSGAILISVDGENALTTGYDCETWISLDNENFYELSTLSVNAKITKNGESDMMSNSSENTPDSLTPYMITSNAFYTIAAYDLGREIDYIICEHIEKFDTYREPEQIVYIKRILPNGDTQTHKCMILSDSQIQETPSTFRHYIINLQAF